MRFSEEKLRTEHNKHLKEVYGDDIFTNKDSPSIMGGGRMSNPFVLKSIKRVVTNSSLPSIIREGMIMNVVKFEIEWVTRIQFN